MVGHCPASMAICFTVSHAGMTTPKNHSGKMLFSKVACPQDRQARKSFFPTEGVSRPEHRSPQPVQGFYQPFILIDPPGGKKEQDHDHNGQKSSGEIG